MLRSQEQRLGKLSKSIKKKKQEINIRTKKFKYYLVSCLLFTADPKRDLNGDVKKPDLKRDDSMYWIINNYEKENWRAYRDLYIAIPFDFPQDFIPFQWQNVGP